MTTVFVNISTPNDKRATITVGDVEHQLEPSNSKTFPAGPDGALTFTVAWEQIEEEPVPEPELPAPVGDGEE